MTSRLRCFVALFISTFVYGGIWYELYQNRSTDSAWVRVQKGVSGVRVSFMPQIHSRAEAPKPATKKASAKKAAPEERMDAVEEKVHAPEVLLTDAPADVEIPVADPTPRLPQRKVIPVRQKTVEPVKETVNPAEEAAEAKEEMTPVVKGSEKKEQKEEAKPAHSGNPGVRSVLRAADNPRISYPAKMVERGIEGRVRVKVWLADNGSVTRLVIVEKDPHQEFNREVQETVKRWTAERVSETDRVLTIAVRFWLRNGRPAVSPRRSG